MKVKKSEYQIPWLEKEGRESLQPKEVEDEDRMNRNMHRYWTGNWRYLKPSSDAQGGDAGPQLNETKHSAMRLFPIWPSPHHQLL